MINKLGWNSASGGGGGALETRVAAVENKLLKIYYYAEITATSGQVSKPTGATILLNQWSTGEDALVCKIVNGKPDFQDTEAYVATFDVNGNYTLSGALPSNPAALIYVFEIKRIDFDANVDNDFVIQFVEIEQRISYDTFLDLPVLGNSNIIYFIKDTQTFYYWNGSIYLPAESNIPSGALTNDITSGTGWNASTNTPTIYSGTGNEGDFAIVSVAGTISIDGIASWAVGDYIWYDNSTHTWQKIDNQNTISRDHNLLNNLNWLLSGHVSGEITQRVASFGTDGNTELVEVTTSNFYVGDFTGAYAGLATEANWTENISGAVSGALGDRAIGIGAIGAIYECFFSQYGWVRDYINPYITSATLIAALETSGNWTKVTDTIFSYTATIGDRGQKYYNNGYSYECINGTTHLWLRIGNLDTIVVSDINYIPKPQVEVGKGMGDALTIPAKYEIVSIVAESETTTAGNITIGRAATAEVSNLVVTAACSSNGNAQVVLDGITFNVALTTAQSNTTLVATAIRSASFVSGSQVWTTGGTGTTVTFTSNKFKTATDATYSDNGTGASGTMTTTTQGVDPDNNVVTSTALSTTIGNKKNLTVIKNVDYPTSANQILYLNVDSAATVKLHFILQKYFE